MKKEIILKGNGFILRLYKKGDELSLSKNANNKKIAQNMFLGFPSPYTLEEAKKWVGICLKKNKIGPITGFVIDIDGEVAGTVGGEIDKKKPFMLGFGYWLGEKYWGKGIMSEATKLYIDYIFKDFKKINRIESSVFPWNEGSKKVLLKNGFKLEGISRKSYLKDGKIIDVYHFAKLRNE
ncbi:MAG: GNAT family protein [Candidatus Taylorbacteria bacterium]|nr:GNAT family protein [Candidatus Taylorbacteria bacterium]